MREVHNPNGEPGEVVQAFFEKIVFRADAFTPPSVELDKAIFGCQYLHVESQRARMLRDHARVLNTAREVWPTLKKYNLLDEYENNARLRDLVNFFVQNGFGISSRRTGPV